MRDVIAVSFPFAISEAEAESVKKRIKAELGQDEAAVIVVGSGGKVQVFRQHFVVIDDAETRDERQFD